MWMPGAAFKRQAYEWRQSVEAMANRPFDMVKQRMVCSGRDFKHQATHHFVMNLRYRLRALLSPAS